MLKVLPKTPPSGRKFRRVTGLSTRFKPSTSPRARFGWRWFKRERE